MNSFPLRPLAGLVASVGLVMGCSGSPAPIKPPLPPSKTDLILLASTALCERKVDFARKYPATVHSTKNWGSGHELMIPLENSASHAEESYFFDQEGVLVGALFTFPTGLDLKPYPVLRRTLSQLKPSVEFYLNVAQLETRTSMESSALLETGDEKTTTQYLVTGLPEHPVLLQASFTIDPYVRLFSPYRREFLDRLRNPTGGEGGQKMESQGTEDKEPFSSLQQFARGQAAQLAYCGDKNYDVAADAYQKAIASGFTNKVWLAEARHKLGVTWQAKGQFEKAKSELLQSLALRPNIPEVLNNLGTVQVQLGDKAAGLSLFEKAVTLRPNYALARFNLAEVYETTNPKRAISEYETYLALVEGITEEESRVAYAKDRVKALKQ
ncbi:tetratricopeptide repeat protein [Nitrospira sp. BLG_2]|uniref:tetratricopeptide repeat protein n=1 Tax=Nitrospira sp. BLG_2 TaxID=3397507 RepID=UPI003B9D4F62